MTSWEIEALAVYNGEVARGLLHTEEKRKEMAEAQVRFNTRNGGSADGSKAYFVAGEKRHTPWWKKVL